MNEWSSIMERRSCLYLFLHLTFAKEPAPAFWRTAEMPELLDLFKYFLRAGGAGGQEEEALRALAEAVHDQALAKRGAGEYTRLFFGPGSLPAPPWESVYLGKKEMLFQGSTREAALLYAAAGLRPGAAFRCAEDSLALELDYMRFLAERQAEMGEQALLQRQAEFLDGHLLVWTPKMAQRMEQAGESGFFGQMVRLLPLLLKGDRALLTRLGSAFPAPERKGKRRALYETLRSLRTEWNGPPEAVLTKAEGAGKPEGGMPAGYADAFEREDGGRWIPAACWHNCAGRCLNKVLVRDGIPVRQKTDDTHPDSYQVPQQRACVRGRAQQQQCFGADRLRYPMKRTHWQPGGGDAARGDLRGIDSWERISWEEAFALAAGEIKRVRDTWGCASMMTRAGECANTIFKALGGHATYSDSTSFGAYCFDIGMLGLPPWDKNKANDRMDLKNSETIVFYGCNPAWAAPGNRMYHFLEAKRSGKTRFVVVGPSYNATASLFNARWIRVRPGTDTAFLLAVAYEMLAWDETLGNVVDWAFLDRYTVGFDDAHLPKDAKLRENFRDYLFGAYDGIPKTAQWASAITGTPPEDIRWFALEMGKERAVALLHSYAHARCRNAEDIPQLFMTVGCMGGHFGKPGHACGAVYAISAGNCGPKLVRAGDPGLPAPLPNGVDMHLNGPTMWRSILEGQTNNCSDFYQGLFRPKNLCDVNIRLIYWDADARLQTTPNILEGVRAIRTMDFVCCNAQFFTTQAKYADLILPVTTRWERPGTVMEGDRETLFVSSQVTPPLYEAKSDQEIASGILERLGIDPKRFWPVDEAGQFIRSVVNSRVVDEQGGEHPLVTVTERELLDWGLEGPGQQGVIPLKQLLAQGCYQVARAEGDAFGYIGYQDFVEDPERNPLPSPSGKFEIYSDRKAELFNGMGFSEPGTFKPYPTYTVAPEGYETTFRTGVPGTEKGEYPFLVYNPHYLRRAHTVFDNSAWLREAWPNPVFLNRQDAREKGIETGDTVRIYNRWGSVLRKASLTEMVMPGCVALPHGSWLDLDEENHVDRGGSDNVLCGPVVSGIGLSGYNNTNCNYEKYNGRPL